MKLKLLILLLAFVRPAADQYYVSGIKGEVFREMNKLKLKIGDGITPEDQLLFKTSNDKVVLIHPAKGRLEVAAGKNSKATSDNKILVLIKNNLVPSKSIGTLAGRSGYINSLQEFKVYFDKLQAESSSLVGVEAVRIYVGEFFLKDAASKYFYLQYKHGGKNINKRIDFDQNDKSIVLDKKLFTIEGKQALPDMDEDIAMMYYNETLQLSTPVGNFKIEFPGEEELLGELRVVYKYLSPSVKSDEAAVVSEFRDHIGASHGVMEKTQVEKLYQKVKTNP